MDGNINIKKYVKITSGMIGATSAGNSTTPGGNTPIAPTGYDFFITSDGDYFTDADSNYFLVGV